MRGVASNTLKSPFVIKLFMSKCNFYYWPHYQAFQSFEFLKYFDSLKEACIYYVINFCSIPPPRMIKIIIALTPQGLVMIMGQHKLNNSYATCSSLQEKFLLKKLTISYAEIFMYYVIILVLPPPPP